LFALQARSGLNGLPQGLSGKGAKRVRVQSKGFQRLWLGGVQDGHQPVDRGARSCRIRVALQRGVLSFAEPGS
jgi:hypothetical protein